MIPGRAGGRRTRAALLALVAAARLFAAELPGGSTVELPPMVIEEKANLPPWLYARVDDTEYLSRCSESTTRGYAEMQRSRMQWLRSLFPEELFLRMDVPAVTLLLSQKLKPGNTSEAIGDVVELNQQDRSRRGYVRATTAPNVALNDADAVGVFAYIDESAFDRRKLTVSSDYVRFLLERRRPALPVWLREGMMSVYDDIEFDERPITLRPLRWHSAAQARALRKDPDAPRVLLPAAELFSDLERVRLSEVGTAERALLVRWALDPANGVREAFWRFALRACEEPVTEPMFEACFGFGFSDLRDRLSDYLPAAVKGPVELPLKRAPTTAAVEIRRATPSEIARMRGEWERLSVSMLRRRHPEHVTRYVEQARRTLQRAFDDGDRDPRLVAIRGLCEIDAGDDVTARNFLEQAAATGVVRPRAYYELARLRWTALTKDLPATQQFDAMEIERVIEPLRRGLQQAPPLAEAVVLLADVWLRSSAAPSDEEARQLERLGRLFLSEPRVCLRVVRALERHGKSAEAVALLGAGFLHVHDNPTRTQFAQLYATLAKRR